MRAVLIKDGKGSPDALYIGEAERPIPKSGEVLVKVSIRIGPFQRKESVEADDAIAIRQAMPVTD